MKRLLPILLLLTLLAPASLAAKARFVSTPEDSRYHTDHLLRRHTGETLECVGNGVKLLLRPSADATASGKLPQGETVVLLEGKNGFASVERADGVTTGWINPDYLQCDCDADDYYERADRTEETNDATCFACTTNNLRVRLAPKNGAIVGHIEKADRFEILQSSGGWARIRVTYSDSTSRDSWVGLSGWISEQYIEYTGYRQLGDDMDLSWMARYMNWIHKNVSASERSQYRYALIPVNGDAIPELAINTGIEAGGCMILTCSASGRINMLQTARTGFTYLRGKNLLNNSDGHMGSYYDNIYTISSGRWVLKVSGEYDEIDRSYGGDFYDEETGRPICRHYRWNDTATDRAGYWRKLNAVYNTKKAKTPETWLTWKQLREVLE